jgi:hypothetical protein
MDMLGFGVAWKVLQGVTPAQVVGVLVGLLALSRVLEPVLVSVLKRVFLRVLDDPSIRSLATKRYHQMMGTLQVHPAWKDQAGAVVTSEPVQARLKNMFAELLSDQSFADEVDAHAKLMAARLVADAELNEVIRGEVKDVMRDTELHKAARRGAMDAVPDSMMKNIVSKFIDPDRQTGADS